MHHIPNLLTVLRILMAPLFAWALLEGSFCASGLALGLAVSIELTDWFDGYLARRNNWHSPLGRFLDPLADSLARLTAFLALHAVGLVSLPMLLCLFYRDQLVAYLRVHAAKQGQDVGARQSGKMKAIAQAAAIFFLTLGRLLAHPDCGWLSQDVLQLWASPLVSIAVAVTLWSAWDYLRGFRSGLS